MTLSLLFLVCELNTLLCWPELRVLNSPELFTPCEKLLHFDKLLSIYLLSFLPSLCCFCSSSFDPFVISLPPFFHSFLHHPLLSLYSFFGWNMAAGLKESWSEWGASRVDLHNLWRGTGAQTQREMVPTSPRWTELSSPAQRLVTLTGFTAAEFTEGLADISVPTSLAPTVNTVCVWWETVASLIDSYKAETTHTCSHALYQRTHPQQGPNWTEETFWSTREILSSRFNV